MEQVTILPVAEPVRLDRDTLVSLTQQLGPRLAEDVVCRAMEDLSIRLGTIERRFSTCAWEDMHRQALAVAQVADQVGMADVCRVADDVMLCLEQADGAALAATCARLVRVGEASLSAVWNSYDQSG